ncbi:MAG: hypothetical protein ABIR37_02825 [Candidatus Saccharimonadales bacterium]
MSHEDFPFEAMESQLHLAEIDSLAGAKSFAERARQLADLTEKEAILHELFLKVTAKIAECEPPMVELKINKSHVDPNRVFDSVHQVKRWRPVPFDSVPGNAGDTRLIVLEEQTSTSTDVNGSIVQYIPILCVFDDHDHLQGYLDDPLDVYPTVYHERRLVDHMNGFNDNMNPDDYAKKMSSDETLERFAADQAGYSQWLQCAAAAVNA